MNIKRQTHHFPLIERILIIGLHATEIEEYFRDTSNTLEHIGSLKLKILEEYKSNALTPEDEDLTLYENIPKFCLPEGPLHNSFHDTSPPQITSFTLLSKEKKKHITALNYYENYYTGNNYSNKSKGKQFSTQKIIVFVSSKDIYETHKKLLRNINSIMINYYINKSNNKDKIRTVYLSDSNKYYQEYKLIDFYFGFLLNALPIKCEGNDIRSYCIYNIPNNKANKYFLTYCTNDTTHFPLKDYNMSILLEQFHVEDLIYLYQSMLMEYKIIILFENYEEINIILYSLASLIFPLKWSFLIISYLLNETEMMLDAPFAIMIGAHKSYLSMINKCIQRGQFSPETIIYDLPNQEFIFINSNFPEFPAKMNQELRGGLYSVLSEVKLIQSEDGIDSKNEMAKILRNESLCSKINPNVYLNMRVISIFYMTFLELIKPIKSYINYDIINGNKDKGKDKDSIASMQVSEFFSFDDYINNFKKFNSINISKYISFIKYFSKSLMFNNFILKFVQHSTTKSKFKTVNEDLDIMSDSNEKYRRILKRKIKDIIHNKIIAYYNFRYIDLLKAFNTYSEKIAVNNIATTCNTRSHLLWTPLENYKVTSFNLYYETLPNKPKDNEELLSIYNTLVSSHNKVILEEISPIVSNFDWSAVNNLKHKKTASLINKGIKLTAKDHHGNNIIEEEVNELTSSSSAKMNLIGNKKKIVSLKKVKEKKIGKYDLPLQIKHLPFPLKKSVLQRDNSNAHNNNNNSNNNINNYSSDHNTNANNSKNSIKHSPNPNTNSNGNVPKHQGDDECDLFSDND